MLSKPESILQKYLNNTFTVDYSVNIMFISTNKKFTREPIEKSSNSFSVLSSLCVKQFLYAWPIQFLILFHCLLTIYIHSTKQLEQKKLTLSYYYNFPRLYYHFVPLLLSSLFYINFFKTTIFSNITEPFPGITVQSCSITSFAQRTDFGIPRM